MSDRLDKLRRLQGALDDLLAAVREVDENLESTEAQDLQSVIDEQDEEIERLKVENERLRNAGDAMHLAHEANFNGYPYSEFAVRRVMKAWLAAKGVQP